MGRALGHVHVFRFVHSLLARGNRASLRLGKTASSGESGREDRRRRRRLRPHPRARAMRRARLFNHGFDLFVFVSVSRPSPIFSPLTLEALPRRGRILVAALQKEKQVLSNPYGFRTLRLRLLVVNLIRLLLGPRSSRDVAEERTASTRRARRALSSSSRLPLASIRGSG